MPEKKKSRRGLKILAGVLAAILLFFLTINLIPPGKVMEDNPFLKGDGEVMLAAHRGGSLANPENTLKAYKAAVGEFGVDIVESDLWLTRDGKVVYSHDGTIDRTSDVGVLTGENDREHPISD